MSDDKEPDVIKEARSRFDEAQDADRTNREAALDDLNFRAGEQWPDNIRKAREQSKRPCLTFNRVGQFVRQVTGDLRKSPPAIRVSPVDDNGDVKLAEILTGGIRHIEQSSRASQAYIHAVDGAATCGAGHFRLTTKYCRDDSFDQELKIERIKNHLSVVWDPFSQELDRGDARYCFVYERVPLAVFEKRYPKAQTSDFDAHKPAARSTRMQSNWWDGQSVTVAEYWRVTERARVLMQMPDGSTVWQDEVAEDKTEDAAKAATSKRVVMVREVVQTVLNGVERLEDDTTWLGRRIPIFTVVGEEIELGEGTVRRGLVRDMKDPQRMYNYMRTAGVEATALQPKAPAIMTKSMIAGYEPDWRRAQEANVQYLLFNPDPKWPGGKPERLSPPTPATGMIAEAQSAIDDMYGASGIYPTSLGAKSNETSGRAILARQHEGDTGTYLYVDNLSQAIAACGREMVYLMPKIYDTERVMRVVGEDGGESWAQLNAPLGKDENGVDRYGTVVKPKNGKGKPEILPTLDAGEYDVVVSAGPTFATKRQEASETMMQFVQAAPGLVPFVADLLVKNMDWPGADEISKRLKKALPPGIGEDEDAPQQPQQPAPDPKMVAGAEKDAAAAEKTLAEAEGVKLDNVRKAAELAAMGVPVPTNGAASPAGAPAAPNPIEAKIDALAQGLVALAQLVSSPRISELVHDPATGRPKAAVSRLVLEGMT